MFGGSRDLPTPRIHKCKKTPGCLHVEYSRTTLNAHELVCSRERIARYETAGSLAGNAAKNACPYDGCDYVSGPETKDFVHALQSHTFQMHTWKPKPCEHGCDPEIIYNDSAKYGYHMQKMHTPGFPTDCRFAGCITVATFGARQALERHLKKCHNLQTFEEMEPYFPPPEPKRQYVDNQTCWIGKCDAAPDNMNAMIWHLKTKTHGMTAAEARAAIQANAEFKLVAGTYEPSRKKCALSTKEVEREQARSQKSAKTDD